ncbi:MAG TPA: LLM class flavin-dependent oxidoreductase [Chloroflexota bacterium]|jgi:5,10-methylenetetrahydromethanopterin reductase
MSGPAFGVELFQFPPRVTLDDVRRAEQLGYDAAWLGDSQFIWRDLYVLLGAAAVQTSKVALGSSLSNPVTRVASVTAGAIATLNELSGGRARLGIGVGGTSTGILGVPSATRAQLAAYIREVRALCAGEPVPGARGGETRLMYANAETRPPVYIGGSGPKVLALAGEIGDGVIIGGGTSSPARLEAKLGAVHEGRARAKTDRPFRVCLSVTTAVHADRSLAMAAVRPAVAVNLRFTDPAWPLSEAARAAREAVNALYRDEEHMNPAIADKFAQALPDEVIDEFAIAGTPAECLAKARAIFAAGVDEIMIHPYGVAGGSRGDTIETFAREVIAPLRG